MHGSIWWVIGDAMLSGWWSGCRVTVWPCLRDGRDAGVVGLSGCRTGHVVWLGGCSIGGLIGGCLGASMDVWCVMSTGILTHSLSFKLVSGVCLGYTVIGVLCNLLHNGLRG
jgi:hypothetical protein